MSFDYINEAFKRLSAIDEELFNTTTDGINHLADFMDSDDETIRVIDKDATESEDLKDSYIGKVIVNCNVCHSHIFENKEDIVIDEEGLVNAEEACPYCGEQDGFTIVGEIAPFAEKDVGVEVDQQPVDVDTTEQIPEEDQNIEESINRSIASARTLGEDFKEVSIKTNDQHLEMTSDDNGKISVVSEPITESDITDSSIDAEAISPLSDETTEEIFANNDISEEPSEDLTIDAEASDVTEDELEAPAEEEETEEDLFEESFDTHSEVEFDEIDEEAVNSLTESYFKKVYENVSSFTTTDVKCTPTQMIVEGTITFSSGTKRQTGFIFEAKDMNSRGQLRFTGANNHLAEAKDAFTLLGRVDNKKLFVESLKYNYSTNESVVRGRVYRK